MLFVVYAMDLKPMSEHNRIIKYADDTTLLVAKKSSVDVATEFGHLEDWSKHNKLTINKDKTVEIIFRRPKSRYFLTTIPLPCINQVDEVKLLGVYLTGAARHRKGPPSQRFQIKIMMIAGYSRKRHSYRFMA